MSKYSRRLLILALLSAFVAFSGSTVAAERAHDKGKQKHDRSGDDRQGKSQEGDDKDAALSAKTSVVTVTNRGGGPLTITAVPTITRLSGNGLFTIVPPGTGTPCAPSVVVAPGGGKCTIGVEYIPTDGGKSTARLTLTDTGAATPTQETIVSSD